MSAYLLMLKLYAYTVLQKKIILTSILIFHSYKEVDEYSMPTIVV